MAQINSSPIRVRLAILAVRGLGNAADASFDTLGDVSAVRFVTSGCGIDEMILPPLTSPLGNKSRSAERYWHEGPTEAVLRA